MIAFGPQPDEPASPLYRRLLDDAVALRQLADTREAAAYEIARLEQEVEYHRRSKGNRFEQSWAAQARARGYLVTPPTNRQHDWIVNGKRVECKHKDTPTFSLLTTPVLGRDYRGYVRGDWDVLAVLNTGVLRLIPVEALLHEDGLHVRNAFTPSAFPDWVDRWEVFGSGFAYEPIRQKTFAFEAEA